MLSENEKRRIEKELETELINTPEQLVESYTENQEEENCRDCKHSIGFHSEEEMGCSWLDIKISPAGHCSLFEPYNDLEKPIDYGKIVEKFIEFELTLNKNWNEQEGELVVITNPNTNDLTDDELKIFNGLKTAVVKAYANGLKTEADLEELKKNHPELITKVVEIYIRILFRFSKLLHNLIEQVKRGIKDSIIAVDYSYLTDEQKEILSGLIEGWLEKRSNIKPVRIDEEMFLKTKNN